MYVTSQELIDTYGREEIAELTDRADPPTGQIDAARLQRAIDAAVDLTEGYLGVRYQLPLAAIPVELQDHVRALVFFNLHRGRSAVIDEGVRASRDEAIAYLEKVSRGEILLQAATPPPVTGVGSPGFATVGRTFDFGTLRNF